MGVQSDWRWCRKCFQLFFNGNPSKGKCPAGDSHDGSASFNYHIPHGTYETATAQQEWRWCNKCETMFYNGFGSKGVCTAGGQHDSNGSGNYVPPHDTAQTATAQPGWRFCDKCFVMFFDGDTNKGVCRAGGGHHSQGYLFVIPHDLPSYLDFHWSPIVFGSGVPVGGNAHLTIRSDGSYIWWGHFHDSGFSAFDASIAWAVKDSQNTVYGFTDKGHMAGTINSGSRDHNWRVEGRNDAIADRWAYIGAGQTWKANAHSGLDLGAIVKTVKDGIGAVGTVVSVVGAFA